LLGVAGHPPKEGVAGELLDTHQRELLDTHQELLDTHPRWKLLDTHQWEDSPEVSRRAS